LYARNIPVVERASSDIAYIYSPFSAETRLHLPRLASKKVRVRVGLNDVGDLRESDIRLFDLYAPDCLWEPLDIPGRVRIEAVHPNAKLLPDNVIATVSRGTLDYCRKRIRLSARALVGVFLESGPSDEILAAGKKLGVPVTIHGRSSEAENEYEFSGLHQDVVTWMGKLFALIIVSDLGVDGLNARFVRAIAEACSVPVRSVTLRRTMNWSGIISGVAK
jgi:hypothetical protein